MTESCIHYFCRIFPYGPRSWAYDIMYWVYIMIEIERKVPHESRCCISNTKRQNSKLPLSACYSVIHCLYRPKNGVSSGKIRQNKSMQFRRCLGHFYYKFMEHICLKFPGNYSAPYWSNEFPIYLWERPNPIFS